MKILSFDPGGTTGVCIYIYDKRNNEHLFLTKALKTDKLKIDGHHLALWRVLSDEKPHKVICEDFNYRRKDKVVQISRDYIGVITLYCKMTGTELVMQQPMGNKQGTTFWNDEKLKKAGLYESNSPHTNDAIRHMLYYLVFKDGKRDLMRWTKPTYYSNGDRMLK